MNNFIWNATTENSMIHEQINEIVAETAEVGTRH